jgi:hypothetical protein
MANLIGQVTIPAGGKIQLSTGIGQITGGTGAGQGYAQGNLYVQQLQVQNNGSHTMRLGDVTVSATRGLILAAGNTTPQAPDNIGGFVNYCSFLSDWWVFGTVGDVCDFLYVQ